MRACLDLEYIKHSILAVEAFYKQAQSNDLSSLEISRVTSFPITVHIIPLSQLHSHVLPTMAHGNRRAAQLVVLWALISIPKIEPWGEELAYPIAAQCCKSGGTCSMFGCEYPDGQGQGASNSTGTGIGTGTGTGSSGSCSAPFTCAPSNICVPTLLPDYTASANVIPAQCCTSGQFCGATGCHNNAFDGRAHPRRFKRARGGVA